MKQIIKKSLAKFGFFNSNHPEKGIDEIKLNDTFIVSYPKSGNTWVRFIIANILSKDTLVTLKNINDFVPGIYGFTDKINSMLSPRFIKSHHTNFHLYPKSIYIYRDYRDVLISYYHFQKKLNMFKGSLSDFIKSKNIETFGSWKDHISSAIAFQKKHPEKMLLVSYENILSNPEKEIERIAKFINITPHKSNADIAELCSFKSLQSIEQKHGRVYDDTPGLTFFRSGSSNQWKKELSGNDLSWVLKENKSTLTLLGYDV